MEALSPEFLLLLFLIGLLAGGVDSIAGGGGLLTIPALLWMGLPPLQTLATNKAQAVFGSFTAALNFHHKGHLRWRELRGAVVFTFIGAVTGAYAVRQMETQVLADVIPLLLMGFALYFLLSPRMGDVDARQRIGHGLFGLIIGGGVGFYDGFFGPGTGSFFAVAHVALLGMNLRQATAHSKVLNFTSNFASLLFFIASGLVVWPIALAMAVGQASGGYIGSHLVMRHGAWLVRPLLVIVSLLMSLKLWLD